MESRSSEIVALQEEIRRLRVTEAKCARTKDWDGAQKAEESCIAIEASVQTILREEIDRLQEQEVECVKAKNWAHAKQITAELAALEALNGQVTQLSAAPRSGVAQSSAVTVVPVNNPEGMKSKISEPPRASIATPPSDALPPPSSLPEPESPSVPEQDEHETERRRSEGMVDPEGPPPEVSLLEENHVSWQMQEIEKKSSVKRRIHGMHSITSFLKRWAPLFESVCHSIPMIGAGLRVLPLDFSKMIKGMMHLFSFFLIFGSDSHMVLITASKEDGERTRYLAKDTRSASQRVLAGFGIGAPPQYCIYELDGSVDGQAILEVKKSSIGRATLQTPGGTAIATTPSSLFVRWGCGLSEKEWKHRGKRTVAMQFYDPDGDNVVEGVLVPKPAEAPKDLMTNCVAGSTYKYTFVPWLPFVQKIQALKDVQKRGSLLPVERQIPALALYQAHPWKACYANYCFPKLTDVVEDLQLQRPEESANGPQDGLQLLRPNDSASAPQGSNSNAEQKSLAEALYLTASDGYCSELEKYVFVKNSHTTYQVKTTEMDKLKKAALLLWLFHFEHKYGAERAH